MKKMWIGMLIPALIAVWGLSVLMSPASADETQREFVGATKCKMCHKTAAQGEQYPKWMETRHAKAYETLASDKAKAIAKEKGIENPQTASECLKCHVAGHGVDAKYHGTKYDVTEGVSCEACHGAGGDYYKKSTMESVASGEIEAASVGLVIPTKELCVKCHNKESPTFESFDFDKMVAKIAHPIPEERKAKYKAASE